MSNITKNHKIGIFTIFIASALMLGTISVSGFDNALATGDKHKDKKGSDSAVEQEIEMSQSVRRDSSCVSGVISVLCGNNVGVNLQFNTGQQAAGQE